MKLRSAMPLHKNPSLITAAIAIVAQLLLHASAAAQSSAADMEAALETFLTTERGEELVGKAAERYLRRKQQLEQEQLQSRHAKELEQNFKNLARIDAGSSPVTGPAAAKVTIIEFSDFQCPYCRSAAQTMKDLLAAYPSDVRLVFKNLPLQSHPQARPAAMAALAAGKQGKFWEMHDALFENQTFLNDALFTRKAGELGLDIAQFKRDSESAEIAALITDDIALAKKHNINGTPAFFINGVALRGAYPASEFKHIIERWLSAE